jgi:hypothetical protein
MLFGPGTVLVKSPCGRNGCRGLIILLEVRCESKGIKRREDSWNGLESLLDVGFGRDKVMGALHVVHVERRLELGNSLRKQLQSEKQTQSVGNPGMSQSLECLRR